MAGPAGSGSRATWEAMLKALGWKDGQTPRTIDMPVDGPAIDSLVAAAPYLKKGRIPADAYGLPEDVPSFGVNAILMTTADMEARAVSDFAVSLGTQIKALEDKSPVLQNLNTQDIVTEALPAPLHPAALDV